MITRDVADCNSKLNFKPHKSWDISLPILCWQNYLLTHFEISNTNLDNQKAIDLSQKPANAFIQIFHSIYPQLTFVELARFYTLAKNENLVLNWHDFFKAYNYRFCESLVDSIDSIIKSPLYFQNWCQNKDISPRDIEILKCLNKSSNYDSLFTFFTTHQINKNFGVQSLEIAVELFLMETPIDKIVACYNPLSPENTLHELKRLRYPNDTNKLENSKKILNAIPQINGVESYVKRYGDRSGIEFKFFTETPDDFNKKMKSLIKWNELRNESPWI
jgi:hypothetical protein